MYVSRRFHDKIRIISYVGYGYSLFGGGGHSSIK